jgi:hypothetical protein
LENAQPAITLTFRGFARSLVFALSCFLLLQLAMVPCFIASPLEMASFLIRLCSNDIMSLGQRILEIYVLLHGILAEGSGGKRQAERDSGGRNSGRDAGADGHWVGPFTLHSVTR